MSSVQSAATAVATLISSKVLRPERIRVPADEGLVLTDMMFQAIAVDEGATWILTQQNETEEMWPDARIRVPLEIRRSLMATALADLAKAKLRFRVGKFGYHCRIFVLKPPNDSAAEPLLALRLRRDMSASDAVYLLAEEYHLTDRERETLKAIANGLTSKEAAEHMSISPNTVKSFMRVIMLKMGVGSRAALLGKLLEYTNDFNE